MSECGPVIAKSGDLSERNAEQLATRMVRIAEAKAVQDKTPIAKALRDIAGEIQRQDKMAGKVAYRNELLTVQALRNLKNFSKRFKSWAEGLDAKLVGSNKRIPGARDSVDYNSKALHGQYFSRLVNELDDEGVLHDFKTGSNKANVYREFGGIANLSPKSVTGDQSAFKIAKVIKGVWDEMVARQNRAGAYIYKMPLFDTLQSHDQARIRELGSMGNNAQSRAESLRAWDEFTRPLLDPQRNFMGADPDLFMRTFHEVLYSGVHGKIRDDANVMLPMITDNLSKKVSEPMLLHFRDADAALAYNEKFGIRDFKQATMNDIYRRSRTIGLMEGLGPYPERTIEQVKSELAKEARGQEDAAFQADELRKRNWKIDAAMGELTGANDIPGNFTLHRFMGTTKVLFQLAKMGGVTLSSFADKAFMQSEAMFQGMRQLEMLGKQVTGMFPRSDDQKSFVRMLGVGMHGLMSNTLSRYTSHSSMSGWAFEAQRRFFDLTLLNQWTDANKSTIAEMMSSHLGEHANLPFDQLPERLRNVLSLYDINQTKWGALRSTAWGPNEQKILTPTGETTVNYGQRFITPDRVSEIPEPMMRAVVEDSGLTPSATNIQRARDRLETSLRTYFQDRADIAIPSPGVATKRWATMGTQSGTPLGEAVRMIMLFKSFPITVMDKIVGRHIYGNGADSLKEFLMSDHRGKFDLAMLVGMATAAGYLSGVAHDTLQGKSPKPLVVDGMPNWFGINDAALRGGGLGIMGDVLLTSFNHDYRTFLQYAAGPIAGQLDSVAALKTAALPGGGNFMAPAGRLVMDNAPFINLFYLRPILDYYAMWNLQEMLSPGSLQRREQHVEDQGQQYFLRPSTTTR